MLCWSVGWAWEWGLQFANILAGLYYDTSTKSVKCTTHALILYLVVDLEVRDKVSGSESRCRC